MAAGFVVLIGLGLGLGGAAAAFAQEDATTPDEAPAAAPPAPGAERSYLRVSEPMLGGLVMMAFGGLARRARRARIPPLYDERIVR